MKPVLIMLPGPSVQELEDRIQEFRGFDVIWATVTPWEVFFDYFILNKIEKITTFTNLNCDPMIRFNVGLFGNLLVGLVIEGATQIFLFGADGGLIPSNPDHYYKFPNRPIPDISIDTSKLNNNFIEWTKGYKAEIYNCSLESHITIFPKITYDDAIKKIQTT